jgi:hypothetical protein
MREQEQNASATHCAAAKRWPTPAEIQRLAAEIRRAWSPKRRTRRWETPQAFDTDRQDAKGGSRDAG